MVYFRIHHYFFRFFYPEQTFLRIKNQQIYDFLTPDQPIGQSSLESIDIDIHIHIVEGLWNENLFPYGFEIYPAISHPDGSLPLEKILTSSDVLFHLSAIDIHTPLDKKVIVYQYQNHVLFLNTQTQKGVLFILSKNKRYVRIHDNIFYILVSYLFLINDGIVFHGVGFSHRQNGYIFLGSSGSGKSTLQQMNSGKTCYADDGVVIARRCNAYGLLPNPFYQFPYQPDHSRLKEAQLRAIFFINQSPDTYITPFEDRMRVLPMLLMQFQQFYPFFKGALRLRAIDFTQEMLRHIPCYHLYFSKQDADIFQLIDQLNLETNDVG